MHVTELAQKNIPDGWVQVIKGHVEKDHLLWNFEENAFKGPNSFHTPVIGDLVSDKYCVITKEEEREIKIKFKTLKKVLKENPELTLTKDGALATEGQIRVGIVTTLNSIWTAKLGEDFVFQIPSVMEDLKRFIEREYDDTHILTWDRIDKTKESWLTVRDLLDDKDYKGAGIQLEQLRDHIAVIISKLHDYDKKSVNKDRRIEVQDRRLIEKDKVIDSIQHTLNKSKDKYEATIKDLRAQLGSLETDSREAIMKRKFIRIIKN